MLEIDGVSSEQLHTLQLSTFRKNIITKKEQSSVVYGYSSLAALEFELDIRSNIVAAARALEVSGARFANFDNSKCGRKYWIRTMEGGFQLKEDVLPSVGIQDIFQNGELYAFECATAIVIILYKSIISTLGEKAFNTNFRNLLLWDWNYDRNLRLTTVLDNKEAYAGDVLYFTNPDYNPNTPEWQGENVIMLDNDLYFGHGIGITLSNNIISTLNKFRKPGSSKSAYLSDEVIHSEFEHLHQLQMQRSCSNALNPSMQAVVIAAIGTNRYIHAIAAPNK